MTSLSQGRATGVWYVCLFQSRTRVTECVPMLNSVTRNETFPISRIYDCIDKGSKANYVTMIDLLKGFYQVP